MHSDGALVSTGIGFSLLFLLLCRLFAHEHQRHDEREMEQGELEQLARGGTVGVLVESGGESGIKMYMSC